MKYYKLDINEISNRRDFFPSWEHDSFNPFGQYSLNINLEILPNYEVVFAKLYLKEPPYTDNIGDSAMGYGLTLSERAKELFEKFNLGTHRFYDLGQVYDGPSRQPIPNKYFRLQIIKQIASIYLNYIDFENSLWIKTEGYSSEKEEVIRISSYVEYLILKATHTVFFKRLVFKKDYEAQLPDLFKLHEIRNGYNDTLICSERLKNAIEDNQLTGFRFDELNIIFD